MRIAIYVRVSTVQQVQAQTIDQQITCLQTYCQSQHWPWETAQIFRDDGYSSAVLQRPGLEQLRHHAAHATFDVILMTSPDRLARNYIHQMLLLEEFTRAGCPVQFVDQPPVHTPHDQLLLQIRSAVAEYERSIIIDRLRRGRHYKYQHGLLLPWTITPFGYRTDPDRPRDPQGVHCDPVTAPVVATMFRTYLEPGATLASVAKWLSACQVPTPSGHQVWRTNSVRRMLANPVYKGDVYAGQERSRPTQRRRSPLTAVGRRGRTEHRTQPEEWIFLAHVPAIVSAEVWQAVQAKLATNQQRARRNNTAHAYLLRALVSCGQCRMTCYGQTRRNYSYYTCVGKRHPVRTGRAERCRARMISVRQLDAFVWADVCAILLHPDLATEAFRQIQAGADLPQELQARQAGVERAKTHLLNQRERLQELEQRLVSIDEQAHQLEVQALQQQTVDRAIEHLEHFCERVRMGLTAATFEQKRQLVELLINRVIVTDDEVEIRYVLPISVDGEQVLFYQLRIDYYQSILLRRIGRNELLRQAIKLTRGPKAATLEDQPIIAANHRYLALWSERPKPRQARHF